MPVLQALLAFTGIEPERFVAKWVSASEGALFAQTVREFTETLRELPPMAEVLQDAEENHAS
jgi:coenzyme F420-reducing hydrogenase delta subunit